MGSIFVSAGHGGFEGSLRDPGAIAFGTTEAQELILTRDLLVAELQQRGIETFSVPDILSLVETIAWINNRCRPEDVAVELHADAFSNPQVRGASAFYIGSNPKRKADADLILNGYLRRCPEIPNRGAKADTEADVGSLAFCRGVSIPSLLIELGFLTNPDDLRIIQTRRPDVALGLADGLEAWLKNTDLKPLPTPTPAPSPARSPAPTPAPTPIVYSLINIQINGAPHEEQGILVNENAFVPSEVLDVLDIKPEAVDRRITYNGVVFVRAIDLRDRDISVAWDRATISVSLRSRGDILSGVGKIMGRGLTTAQHMTVFLTKTNRKALAAFPNLPQIYVQEAAAEGVNHDLAFCQMCLETNYLNFSGAVKPEQFNFADMGIISPTNSGISFPDARTGIRAQIQHLKAYGSTEPINQPLVQENVRFRFVKRGVAPTVNELAGRWNSDPLYGQKIINTIRLLYENAGLL
ncbi:N-acetylmuramoyl-L-alanine amidase [Microcoleus vaginatus GB1-A2]|uniref:hormogonium tapered terminus morphoprotein TftA n=1 Tax=Microcoleus vaginatus TaxID=119532 RepID=UPI001686834A|nr:N-acetylmuramoyl-L-alanine amidase [Microcoleus sp. FACHB-61]